MLFAIEGRDAATVERFAQDLRGHGGDPDLVTDTSSDMSVAFICGISGYLPHAQVTFDRFHVMAKLSEAIDDVPRAGQNDNPALKKTRYVWLNNETNLTARQRETPSLADPPVDASGHRPGTPLARGLPSLLRPQHGRCRDIPAPLVLRRQAQPAATHQRLRPPRRGALGRHHRLASKPPQQRTTRGNQLPHPGRQGQSTWLPKQEEDDHHYLSHSRQTAQAITLRNPHDLAKNQKMLTQTLRDLERSGLVHRRVFDETPPRVEYTLTDVGRSLLPVIQRLCDWAVANMPHVEDARSTFDTRHTTPSATGTHDRVTM